MIDTSIPVTLLNKSNKNTLSEQLGIEFINLSESFLEAHMPVDQRTHQQLGMMHGGASAALAEMTGSMAAYLSIDREHFYCVGLELKINHLKPVLQGFVKARAEALHEGKQTQVWQIKTYDDTGSLVANSILTMAVVPLNEHLKKQIGNIFDRLA